MSEQFCVLDLETAALPNAADYIDLASFSAPANYKAADKIAANIEEQRVAALEKAALDVDLARIVAIGIGRGNDTQVEICRTEADELDALQLVWGLFLFKEPTLAEARAQAKWRDEKARDGFTFQKVVVTSDPTFVGFNCLSFDLPMLLRRSLYLGVAAPVLNLDKYRTPHIDLMQKLTHNGLLKARSLKWYAKRFGLDVPADPHTGADIARLVSDGDWAAVAAHCKNDILCTFALARRLGVIPA